MNADQAKPRGLRDARSRVVSRRKRGAATVLRFEALEARRVLSSFGDPLAGEPALDLPNQTYDRAVDLGDVVAAPEVTRRGSLGAGEAGAGDVEWYRFALDRPAQVRLRLEAAQPGSSFRGALSLFSTDVDFVNYANPLGLRRLVLDVADGGDGVAAIDRVVGPGTYNLAVSGAGNEIFSPIVAHTGLPGSTGEFELSLVAVDAGIEASAGPWVLNAEPAPGALLDRAPLVIRVDLSRSLDPATIELGRTVRLEFSADGMFEGAEGGPVPLAALNFSISTGELQLVPMSPLAPGYYRIALAGRVALGQPVLAGLDGAPLGRDSQHPAGRDYDLRFQVGGIEGSLGLAGPANDTPAGARDLGDLTSLELVRVEGAIGDDPFYTQPDPDGFDSLFLPSNDVDLYHFRVSGPGRYTFAADVFAGRINSYLSPGLRLFRVNAETQQWELLDLNSAGYDFVPSSGPFARLQLNDATMSGGLDAGDYYLAVSSGVAWSFDPAVSHSYQDGYTTGQYVLNLLVRPAQDEPPRVVETSLGEGEVLTEAPTHLVVQFDHSVNLPVLMLQALEQTHDAALAAVSIRAEDGTRFFPLLHAYDYATNRATFLMFDRLTSGRYELHLSGAQGLLDLTGQPLAGNHPSGDYVVSFSINESMRGAGSDPSQSTAVEPNDRIEDSQDLGTMFPNSFYWGTNIERAPGQAPDQGPSDTADVYRFDIFLPFTVRIELLGHVLPDGVTLTLRDASGQVLKTAAAGDETYLFAPVIPGVYFVEVAGWSPDQAGALSYQLNLAGFFGRGGTPGLLTSPAPAVAIQLGSGMFSSPSDPSGPNPNGGGDQGSIDYPSPDDPPPGNNAPGLPTAPSEGGAIVINAPKLSGNKPAAMLGIEGPRAGESWAFGSPFQGRPAAGPSSSSTDLSALAFQPVGGVPRIEEELAAQLGSTFSEAIAPTAAVTLSSQAVISGMPARFGFGPALPLEIASGRVFLRPAQGNAGGIHPTGPLGLLFQALVPWAPDSNPVDPRRIVVLEELRERAPKLKVSKQVRQTLAAEKDVVPTVIPAREATPPPPPPALAPPSAGDDLGTGPEVVAGSAAPASAARSESEEETGWPLSWQEGLALLALTGLSSLAYLRFRKSFRPRWSSRWALGGDPGKRPGLGEPEGWA